MKINKHIDSNLFLSSLAVDQVTISNSPTPTHTVTPTPSPTVIPTKTPTPSPTAKPVNPTPTPAHITGTVTPTPATIKTATASATVHTPSRPAQSIFSQSATVKPVVLDAIIILAAAVSINLIVTKRPIDRLINRFTTK